MSTLKQQLDKQFRDFQIMVSGEISYVGTYNIKVLFHPGPGVLEFILNANGSWMVIHLENEYVECLTDKEITKYYY